MLALQMACSNIRYGMGVTQEVGLVSHYCGWVGMSVCFCVEGVEEGGGGGEGQGEGVCVCVSLVHT